MRPIRSTPKTLHRAGELCNEATPAEKKLWAYLRQMWEDGVRFRRHCPRRPQAAIKRSVTRVTEHLDEEDYDKKRTAYLESRGYRVIRFWNNNVMNNIEGVIQSVHRALEEES